MGVLKKIRLYSAADTTEALTSAPEHFTLEPGASARSEPVQLQEGKTYLLQVVPDAKEDAAPYRIEFL
jgi:hypothetical protein